MYIFKNFCILRFDKPILVHLLEILLVSDESYIRRCIFFLYVFYISLGYVLRF